MLWFKSFHIVFVVSWYAGLVYLPRLFVNLAAVEDIATTERLLLMTRKLYRFTTMLAVVGLGLGLVLWLHYGIGKTSEGFSAAGWLQAKLFFVILFIGYHHACGSLLKKFENNQNKHSEKWFRVFNEVPVLLLLAIVILVVVKPF
ncbi:MAG TPA: CopD family protein [Burkholderiaceae bacterium]|jgi:putative membrane protein